MPWSAEAPGKAPASRDAAEIPYADEPTFQPPAIEPLRQLERATGRPLLSRLAARFDEDSARLVARIAEAIAAADAESLRLAAHTLKSSSAQLGGRRLSVACRELELLARDGAIEARACVLSDTIACERSAFVRALTEHLLRD